jgi:hypothetical protein
MTGKANIGREHAFSIDFQQSVEQNRLCLATKFPLQATAKSPSASAFSYQSDTLLAYGEPRWGCEDVVEQKVRPLFCRLPQRARSPRPRRIKPPQVQNVEHPRAVIVTTQTSAVALDLLENSFDPQLTWQPPGRPPTIDHLGDDPSRVRRRVARCQLERDSPFTRSWHYVTES